MGKGGQGVGRAGRVARYPMPAATLKVVNQEEIVMSLKSLLAALALALVSTGAPAQNYPNKTIRLVVPFAAGGIAFRP